MKIPRPELYVIFSGDKKDCPKYISLKDEFFDGVEAAIDAKVRVICDGRPRDIISQYIRFTKVAKEQIKIHGKTRKAIEETIRVCRDEDVLADYLKEREVEVMDIMTALFDDEEIERRYHLRIKRETERENSENIARGMIQKGKLSFEEIAEYTGLTLGDIETIAKDCLQLA